MLARETLGYLYFVPRELQINFYGAIKVQPGSETWYNRKFRFQLPVLSKICVTLNTTGTTGPLRVDVETALVI